MSDLNPVLAAVRRRIGRRTRVTRAEMTAILADLHVAGHINLDTGWGGSGRDPGAATPSALAEGWAGLCSNITVVSLLDGAREPGEARMAIRYDQPGSMHPMLRASAMFVSAPARRETLDWLRDRARRVLIVQESCDGAPPPAGKNRGRRTRGMRHAEESAPPLATLR